MRRSWCSMITRDGRSDTKSSESNCSAANSCCHQVRDWREKHTLSDHRCRRAAGLARLVGSRSGRASQLCPGGSEVDLLRDLDRVINLDIEVANGALDLGVAEK
jgi:hypothetical protein